MTQYFSIIKTSPLDSNEFDSTREAARKILILIHRGHSINQVLERGLLPPTETSSLILQMITAGIIVPKPDQPTVTQQVQIVTDSAADLPKELAEQLDILQVPLQVRFGQTVFADGVDLDAQTFYRMLAANQALPTTSPPSLDAFHRIFDQVIGERDILCIHLSKRMSKTADIAEQTIRKYFNAYLRKRKEGSRKENRFRIEVIDSKQVSMGTALLAIEAAECARKGLKLEEIRDHILSIRDLVQVNFMVDKLDHLARGGRIGRGSAFLGNLFGLKPILNMTGGGVNAHSRSLGGRFAQRKLLQTMKQEINPINHNTRIGICHSASPEKAKTLEQMIEGVFPEISCITSDFGPTVGSHIGPGAVGVSWLSLPKQL